MKTTTARVILLNARGHEIPSGGGYRRGGKRVEVRCDPTLTKAFPVWADGATWEASGKGMPRRGTIARAALVFKRRRISLGTLPYPVQLTAGQTIRVPQMFVSAV